MTTAEYMAVAVLKGDMTAARALAEHLMEDLAGIEGDRLIPIKKITTSIYNYRIVAYIKDEVEIDTMMITATIEDWVREGGVLICSGVDRIEIYNE